MSAWSNKPFGNDSALDWLGCTKTLNAEQFRAFLYETLRSVQKGWTGDSDDGEKAIAAIGLVAAAAIEPIGPCPKEVKELILKHGFVPELRLIESCLEASRVVCFDEQSELRELWDEQDGLAGWIKQVEKLNASLNSALKKGLPNRVPKKQVTPRTLIKLIELYKIEPSSSVRQKIAEKFEAISDLSSAADKELDFKSPLYLAALHGFYDEVQKLISRGADPNGDGKSCFGPSPYDRPFDAACLNGHLKVAQLLVACGAKVFFTVLEDQTTSDSYKRVLAVGGKPKKKGDTHWVALEKVCYGGPVAAIEYLRSLGATLFETNFEGAGVAHWEAQGGNVQVLEYLANSGFDLDQPVGNSGPSPLHEAVEKGRFEAATFLLNKRSDPNRINRFWVNDPWTPMSFLTRREKNDKKMVELFQSFNAKKIEDLEYS
jgi:hypothetical protein